MDGGTSLQPIHMPKLWRRVGIQMHTCVFFIDWLWIVPCLALYEVPHSPYALPRESGSLTYSSRFHCWRKTPKLGIAV